MWLINFPLLHPIHHIPVNNFLIIISIDSDDDNDTNEKDMVSMTNNNIDIWQNSYDADSHSIWYTTTLIRDSQTSIVSSWISHMYLTILFINMLLLSLTRPSYYAGFLFLQRPRIRLRSKTRTLRHFSWDIPPCPVWRRRANQISAEKAMMKAGKWWEEARA